MSTADAQAGRHAAFAGFSQVLPLSGFSGAIVALVKPQSGAQFVRKVSKDCGGSAVLAGQAQRQRWLREEIAGSANVPEVLDEGTISDCYYYDMAFVPSRDANTFLAQAPFGEIAGFAGRIEALMAQLAATRRTDDSAQLPTQAAIGAKLDEIARRTEGRFQHVLAPLVAAVTRIDALVDRQFCTVAHGDLTFENILVGAEGRITLIDPIASPIDHYWIDWSKLFQDCEGRWHQHRDRKVSLGVTWWLRNRWLAAATRLDPQYPARHHLMLALTFARILPYARSDADIAFVAHRVETFGRLALDMS